MTFITVHISTQQIYTYTIKYMEILVLGLSQSVGETVFIRFENSPYEGLGHTHSANH